MCTFRKKEIHLYKVLDILLAIFIIAKQIQFYRCFSSDFVVSFLFHFSYAFLLFAFFHLLHNFSTDATLRSFYSVSSTSLLSCIDGRTIWNYFHIISKIQLESHWAWYFCTQNRRKQLQIWCVPDAVQTYIIRNFFENTINGICTGKPHTSNGIWYNSVVLTIVYFTVNTTVV